MKRTNNVSKIQSTIYSHKCILPFYTCKHPCLHNALAHVYTLANKINTWKTPWNLQEHKLLFAFSTKRDRKWTTTKKTHLSKIIRLGSLPKQYNVELKTRYLFMTYISNAHLYRSVLVSRSMFFVRSSCIRLFCSALKNYWFCCMHCVLYWAAYTNTCSDRI